MTLGELSRLLHQSKLHRSEYYICEPVRGDGYYIARLEDAWEVGISPGAGGIWPVRGFRICHSESEACEYLWSLVVADGRAGAAAPPAG